MLKQQGKGRMGLFGAFARTLPGRFPVASAKRFKNPPVFRKRMRKAARN